MINDDSQRFPHLSKVSIALLEHLVSPVLGSETIKELKAPVLAREQRDSIIRALAEAEKRFIAEYVNAEIREAVLSLPLADLPSVQKAVSIFYARPTDRSLANTLQERLIVDFPDFSEEQVELAVSTYLTKVREELVYVSTEIRDKLSTLAQIAMQEDMARTAAGVEQLVDILSERRGRAIHPGSAPPMPSLIVGRESALRDLKKRLGIGVNDQSARGVQVLTAVRGWPGVGKTTIAAVIAHDPDIAAVFPDGVLWASLGQKPSILSELAAWGRALGDDEILQSRSIEEASTRLAALLRNQRRLLILDDVWKPEHAQPFNVGGRRCALLITTRINSVAQTLAPTPKAIYKLAVLTDDTAFELLKKLAPSVVANYPDQSKELVHELEGLPLALQVAGHLLNVEASYGFDVSQLITDLREGAKLIEAEAPADRADLANEVTPTIAVLLQKSTDLLDKHTHDCYALLGAFAPKPATFDLDAMKAVWIVEDPKPIARLLVDRGLLEPILELGRFQMHALLVMHAKSLLTVE